MNILFPCADESLAERDRRMCKVYYARTAERLIYLCNEFGLCNLHEYGILTLIINGRRKIRLHDPKKIAAEDKEADENERICYFDGMLGDIDVFVKRVPINRNNLKENVELVYKKFSRLERVVKLFLVESDEKFHYFAFEKMDMNLATYIEMYKTRKFTINDQEREFRLK